MIKDLKHPMSLGSSLKTCPSSTRRCFLELKIIIIIITTSSVLDQSDDDHYYQLMIIINYLLVLILSFIHFLNFVIFDKHYIVCVKITACYSHN